MAARRTAQPAHRARGAIRGADRVSRALGAFAESTDLEPDAHELSIGPVANVHRPAEGNSAAARHSDPHLGNSVCDGARIHWRDRARHRDRRGPVVVGETLQGARSVLVVANAMPKTAFVPIFYLWLGASLSIYGMSLAISLFITILMIYSGFQGIDPNKVKLALTFGASKGQILRKVVLPGSVPTLIAALKVNAGLSLVGVVVGEFQSANLGLGYLIQYGSQIFKMNIVMTAITILAIVSSVMYLAISWLESAVMRRR